MCPPRHVQARKNRLLFEKKSNPDAAEAIDPETGERMAVVTAQPLPFPSPEERKGFYDQAYKVNQLPLVVVVVVVGVSPGGYTCTTWFGFLDIPLHSCC